MTPRNGEAIDGIRDGTEGEIVEIPDEEMVGVKLEKYPITKYFDRLDLTPITEDVEEGEPPVLTEGLE